MVGNGLPTQLYTNCYVASVGSGNWSARFLLSKEAAALVDRGGGQAVGITWQWVWGDHCRRVRRATCRRRDLRVHQSEADAEATRSARRVALRQAALPAPGEADEKSDKT